MLVPAADRMVANIDALGVAVIGDLAELRRCPPPRGRPRRRAGRAAAGRRHRRDGGVPGPCRPLRERYDAP
ncbi:hypothetical protein [Nocardioides daphniae]|uniref:Uncharacterized protein n=1 Tax=Nocardioides daphniae TaxID=402297 RepID=A0A4P7UEH8_9ACTN|nr:hypothetical protein [Nocardioides daphniae]QCC77815.1 hypothetical protein E2C04_12660 [Nocardioides daphniae]